MGFDDAEMDCASKRSKANEMKIRLADKQVSEQDASGADAAARKACRHFKFLCRARRNALLQTLDDPTSDCFPNRDTPQVAAGARPEQPASVDVYGPLDAGTRRLNPGQIRPASGADG
jgi:hypothetical protein